jgi:hypothetical protein
MDKTVKALVILFAVVGIALFGYHWINRWHTSAIEDLVNSEKEACLKKIAQLESEIQQLASDLETQRLAMPTKSDLTNVFGAEKPMASSRLDEIDCQRITAQVKAFFDYLDSKAYLIWPGMNMRAEVMFDDIASRLSANPPVNVGEMEQLHTLVRNVTHFYRVLGKERIELIKEILSSESAVIEPAMAVIYTWITACHTGTGPHADGTPNLSTLYQYASFFLNTLGGRSYLLRRESKVRMMVNFYALAIIDKANDAGLNAYGLDIRPYLDYLFYDLNNQKGLMYRQRYLTQLAAMQEKYQ